MIFRYKKYIVTGKNFQGQDGQIFVKTRIAFVPNICRRNDGNHNLCNLYNLWTKKRSTDYTD
ncbi:MAG: hypothetical protein LBP59_08325 [Planctomycetaceae bacterium]|nr:hypothetical protein [Planctomycetaceae bacterium]